MSFLSIVGRSIIFTIVIILTYMFFNYKNNSNLKYFDLIILVFILNLSIYGIFSKINLYYFLSSIIIVILFRMIYYWSKLRNNNNLINENKTIISHGKLNFKELISSDINLNYVLLELKKKNINSIEEVDLAFIKNNDFIIFKRSNNVIYPIPVIVDGVVFDDTLSQIKKNRDWLYNNLISKNVELKDIVYGFYKNDNIFLIKKGET